ncbi:FAD-dependent oxidoreductase [Mycobacterium sp.]|uniref:FAD-dependent oxidoreductase n=1 Tax=Mycobacterium sp. TaxID=1785 RepID=UPI0033424CD1
MLRKRLSAPTSETAIGARFSNAAVDGAARPAVHRRRGPVARKLTQIDPSERRAGRARRTLGSKAASPVDYVEHNWTVERYSGGSMMSHSPPGVLTQFGHTLREPCGRIHWAGTESSAVMCGFVDGAIRSGERSAREVMAGEGHTPADDGATRRPGAQTLTRTLATSNGTGDAAGGSGSADRSG